MTAYMRNQFPFLGVKAPGQKAAVRGALAAAGPPVDESEVVAAIDGLWARPEREYRYSGCHLAGRFAAMASPAMVTYAARWITTDPWWDTCDPLARSCVGQVVRRHPTLRSTMDRWLAADNLWLTRSALIHMGKWKDAIDRDWVFSACLARAGESDFFIRKAVGWILGTWLGSIPRPLSPSSRARVLWCCPGSRNGRRSRTSAGPAAQARQPRRQPRKLRPT